MVVPDCECLRCNFKWRKEVETPKRCPRCLSYKWQTPKGTTIYRKQSPKENKPKIKTYGDIDIDGD